MSELKDLIEHICKSLVDAPDKVVVTEIDGDQTLTLEVDVDESDRGKIIGKKGRTADALRRILNGASTKLGKRSVLHIKE